MGSEERLLCGIRQPRAPGAASRPARVLAVMAVFSVSSMLAVAGCGSSEQGGTGGAGSGALEKENVQLREENASLEQEVARLEEEADGLRSEVAEARAQAEEAEATAGEAQAEAGSADSGGELTLAEPADLEGEPLPELVPEDFPLPAGGSVRDVYEDDASFSMTILLDSTFEETVAFYDEQLPAAEWEELVGERVEGETEGFEGVDTSWEKGTYIPQDLPQDDPNYEQTAQSLNVSVYELDPSGVQVEVRWYDYELADQQREAEENDGNGGQTS